jgi:transcriptional regulator GlxA family with amidase domain
MNGFTSVAGGFGKGGLQNAFARQHSDLLLLTMLDRVPNSLSDLIERTSTPATSGHVRRAIEFMRNHLDDPISIDDIARGAGCSPRRLQLAFQAYSGMSPMAELRRLRMEEAEARLRSGAFDSVTDVAMSLCFNNIGRFAVEFRRQFGASPSQLLQTSRRMS